MRVNSLMHFEIGNSELVISQFSLLLIFIFIVGTCEAS